MEQSLAEWVYFTLCGILIPQAQHPAVEDAFAEGNPCEKWTNDLLEASHRLAERLGVEEDEDIETILHNQLMIQQELCLKMFHYGAKMAEKEPTE